MEGFDCPRLDLIVDAIIDLIHSGGPQDPKKGLLIGRSRRATLPTAVAIESSVCLKVGCIRWS